jgi:hypothetical protein
MGVAKKQTQSGELPWCMQLLLRFIAGSVDVTKELTQPTDFSVRSRCYIVVPERVAVYTTHLTHSQVRNSVLTSMIVLWELNGLLSEVQDSQKHVVAYYSRTLSKAKKKYCMT